MCGVWAKSPKRYSGTYPLLCHLLDTAVAAEWVWDRWLSQHLRERLSALLQTDQNTVRRVLILAAAAHDAGKANPEFQHLPGESGKAWLDQARAATGLPTVPPEIAQAIRAGNVLRRHELFTARELLGDWPEPTTMVEDSFVAALCGGHHGFWPAIDTSLNQHLIGDRLLGSADGWPQLTTDLRHIAERVAGITAAEADRIAAAATPADRATALMLLSGLLVLADWSASEDDSPQSVVASGYRLYSAGGADPHQDPAGWIARRRATIHTQITERQHPPIADGDRFATSVMGANQPRPAQQEAISLGAARGLWMVMYPTGDGKTRASMLRHAHNASEGLMFALPTRATTDAMEAEIEPWVKAGGGSLVKSHQYAVRPAGDWYSRSVNRLLAPNLVCTIDQVLTAALAAEHLPLRLTGIANHHLIVDEVHIADGYQVELLSKVMYWCGRVAARVTLLSATMPRFLQERFARDYRAGTRGGRRDDSELVPATSFPGTLFVPADSGSPMLARSPQGRVRQVAQVPFILDNPISVDAAIEAHASWARGVLRSNPSAFVAVRSNTIKSAQRVAELLRGSEAELLCVHASMMAAHRSAVEERILEVCGKDAHSMWVPGSRGVLIVGTSLIGSSLNYSVDAESLDLSPAADLIQMLGRRGRFDDGRGAGLRCAEVPVRIANVRDNEGHLDKWAALPFFVSELNRVSRWLTQHSDGSAGVLDVMGCSQEFVDRTGLDGALEAEHIGAAFKELGRLMRMRRESVVAAADLQGLMVPGRVGVDWQMLATLAGANRDADTAWTRFVDLPGRQAILFDSLAGPDSSAAASGRVPGLPVGSVNALEGGGDTPISEILRSVTTFGVSSSALVDETISRTIGKPVSEWKPKHKMLANLPPIDIQELARSGAHYDPLTGAVFPDKEMK